MPIPGILVTVLFSSDPANLMNMIPLISIISIIIVIILIAGRILNFILIHLTGSDMKSIRTRISIIILTILIDCGCPDGFILEGLLRGRDREMPHERWSRSTIPISSAVGAPRVRSQDNQCSTLQKR
jgi:hypothetical protein